MADYKEKLEIIKKAYDRTVLEFINSFDPIYNIPKDVRNTKEMKEFLEYASPLILGSNCKKYIDYLEHKSNSRFIDIGCGASLFNYHSDRYDSSYFGVDISHELIFAMKNYAEGDNLKIGGLFEADASSLPFENNYFDIASCIGVFEYYDLEYIDIALKEIRRVVKDNAKIVIDIPNIEHDFYEIMKLHEKYQKRPIAHIQPQNFKENLEKYFHIEKVDSSEVMTGYFLKASVN